MTLKTKLNDIHYIAEKFIEEWTETQANTYSTERLEEPNVILVREQIPEYFVALKQDRIVWSHEKRFAKIVKESEAKHITDALSLFGHTVETRVS